LVDGRAHDGWSAFPLIYEINTWPWLARLSEDAARTVELHTVPASVWDAIAATGYDAVWLMGVWERSPAGIAIALGNESLLDSFEAALPGFTPEDVVGSPYCVRDYAVDARLGGREGLATARRELASRGVGLVLDFVPNHVAPDHPWTVQHPDRFINGNEDDLQTFPAAFVRIGDRILANGKDPFFAAWPDVVQLDAFSPSLRDAIVATLRDVADQCDAVRCDMAMLVMNDTFERTWHTRVGARPTDDYWPFVIGAVRATHPEFRFIAEAYWDLEWALQQQGFDYCYDKRLYDRLLHEPAEHVREHLLGELAYQEKLLRFVENHDEPRVASVLDPARERAITVATLSQTGARLVHHGQVEGWRTRLPVFLARYPDEPANAELVEFYETLLAALRDPTFRHGAWQLCDRWGWPGDDRYEQLVAWCWDGATRWLVVVNLGNATAAGLVRAPWPDLRGTVCRLADPTTGIEYDRKGDDVCDGLFVELGPWQWHLFRVEDVEE
jgi:alpha amylase-like protein